ncbi:response regulator [Paenibacillus sp. GCM10023252]|uniref:response regulator transcription factor n=1 Tax=Paenibacillus sp. GCM10023252 TaxID=3252649 RepID=UPI00361194DB
MMQVLLVDDERSVVEGLSLRIPWEEELGVTAVYKATSGAAALAIMEQTSIHIVITDIRMPEMDGLELIRRIRGLNRRTKFILLSGHAEFDYAKEALSSQVTEYLLKPVKDEPLMEAVRLAMRELHKEWEMIASLQQAGSAMRESFPTLRAKLLLELLQGFRYSNERLEERLRMLELPFGRGRTRGAETQGSFYEGEDLCSMLLIRIDPDDSGYGSQDMSLIEYGITNIAEEVLGEAFMVWPSKDALDHLVLLVKIRRAEDQELTGTIQGSMSSVPLVLNDDEQVVHSQVEPLNIGAYRANQAQNNCIPAARHKLLEEQAMDIQQHVEQFLNKSVSIVISEWGSFPHMVPTAYDRLLHEMRKYFGSDTGLLKVAGLQVEVEEGRSTIRSMEALYSPPSLTQLLEAGRWESAGEKLICIFEELGTSWAHSKEHRMEAAYSIMASFSYIAHKNGKGLEELLSSEDMALAYRLADAPLPQLRGWAGRVCQSIRSDLEGGAKSSRTKLVMQIHEYIANNLTNVSMQAIADHVYLNHDYLSKVYKAETGEYLSDYLFRYRMDKAAYMLLHHTQLRIYQIAEQLGYLNTPYFIKVFRKQYGMTPQEYRDK